MFDASRLVVVGLHTVFEHHAVMNEQALEVFLHEYRVSYPMGVDRAGAGGGIPLTMQGYRWRGTPSLALIDAEGRLRLNHFGVLDDLRLGVMLGQLLAEAGDVAPQVGNRPVPEVVAAAPAAAGHVDAR